VIHNIMLGFSAASLGFFRRGSRSGMVSVQ